MELFEIFRVDDEINPELYLVPAETSIEAFKKFKEALDTGSEDQYKADNYELCKRLCKSNEG